VRGAVDYLTKPIIRRVLRHKVAAFADLFRRPARSRELKRGASRSGCASAPPSSRNRRARCAPPRTRRTEFLAILAHELRNSARAAAYRARSCFCAHKGSGVAGTGAHARRDEPPARSHGAAGRRPARHRRGSAAACSSSRRTGSTSRRWWRGRSTARGRSSIAAGRRCRSRRARCSRRPTRRGSRRSSATCCTTPPSSTPEGGTIEVELSRRRRPTLGVRVSELRSRIRADQISSGCSTCSRAWTDRAAGPEQGALASGLALARRLADLHGGTLRAMKPRRGHGAYVHARAARGGRQPR